MKFQLTLKIKHFTLAGTLRSGAGGIISLCALYISSEEALSEQRMLSLSFRAKLDELIQAENVFLSQFFQMSDQIPAHLFPPCRHSHRPRR